jgi:hypothetical protein
MSTYIQVYKNRSKYSKLYLILCLLFMSAGALGLILDFIFNISLIPVINNASYFILISNGATSFWIVWDSMKKSKYFVTWNESEINYLLPKSDHTESIKIENIQSISINRSEINIELNNNHKKHFNLNHFFFPERKQIVGFFEGLKIDLQTTN